MPKQPPAKKPRDVIVQPVAGGFLVVDTSGERGKHGRTFLDANWRWHNAAEGAVPFPSKDAAAAAARRVEAAKLKALKDETEETKPTRKQRVFAGVCPKSPNHTNTRVYKTLGGTRFCVCDDCGENWKQLGPAVTPAE